MTQNCANQCTTTIKPTLNEVILHNHNFVVDFETGVGVCSRCNLEIIAPKLWWDTFKCEMSELVKSETVQDNKTPRKIGFGTLEPRYKKKPFWKLW